MTGVKQRCVNVGGFFSQLPPELIPEVAKHLTISQDLVHFSLTNKSIHLMLLHALFNAELDLAESLMRNLKSTVQQSQNLPVTLARDLVEQYPQTRIVLHLALVAIREILKPAEASLHANFTLLQTIFEIHVKPIKMIMECPDPQMKALSVQEKHALCLSVLANVPGWEGSIPFIEKIRWTVTQIKELIDCTNQLCEEKFAEVQAHLVAHFPLPAQLPAQLPDQVPAQLPFQVPAQLPD